MATIAETFIFKSNKKKKKVKMRASSAMDALRTVAEAMSIFIELQEPEGLLKVAPADVLEMNRDMINMCKKYINRLNKHIGGAASEDLGEEIGEELEEEIENIQKENY